MTRRKSEETSSNSGDLNRSQLQALASDGKLSQYDVTGRSSSAAIRTAVAKQKKEEQVVKVAIKRVRNLAVLKSALSPSARSPASKRTKSQHSDDEDFEMLNGCASNVEDDDDDVVVATQKKNDAQDSDSEEEDNCDEDAEEEEDSEMQYSSSHSKYIPDEWTIGDPQGKSKTYINPECTKKFRGLSAVRRFLKGEKAKKNDWLYTENYWSKHIQRQ